MAIVIHRGTERQARGYSRKEIEETGITCKQFDSLKQPWDSHRKSSYKENVAELKKLAVNLPKVEKPAAKPKAEKPAVKKAPAKAPAKKA